MILNLHIKFTGVNLADHAWLKAKASSEGRTMPQQILALIRQARIAGAREAEQEILLNRLLAEQEIRERA